MTQISPQYINLYQRQRDWRARVLRPRDSLIALGCLIVGLGALTVYTAWNLQDGEREAAQVADEYLKRQAELVAAGAVYSTHEDFKLLERRVAELRELIARQDVVLERLPRSAAAAETSFSDRLTSIARARVDGVWLTRLEIALDPATVRLTGIAMSPDLLPQYLLELRYERKFGLSRLTNLTVDRTVSDPRAAQAGAVGFDLVQAESPKVAGT